MKELYDVLYIHTIILIALFLLIILNLNELIESDDSTSNNATDASNSSDDSNTSGGEKNKKEKKSESSKEKGEEEEDASEDQDPNAPVNEICVTENQNFEETQGDKIRAVVAGLDQDQDQSIKSTVDFDSYTSAQSPFTSEAEKNFSKKVTIC